MPRSRIVAHPASFLCWLRRQTMSDEEFDEGGELLAGEPASASQEKLGLFDIWGLKLTTFLSRGTFWSRSALLFWILVFPVVPVYKSD